MYAVKSCLWALFLGAVLDVQGRIYAVRLLGVQGRIYAVKSLLWALSLGATLGV